MNYQNVDNDQNERVSTNGYVTGEQKGTVTQDAAAGADNDPYFVARTTKRIGTMTPDAEETYKQAFSVTYDLNGAEGTLAKDFEVALDENKVNAAVAPTITKYPSGKQAPFVNWSTEPTGGTTYNAGAQVTLTKDIVLYAQYTAAE